MLKYSEITVCAGHCQQTFENKKFVNITQQCFALLPQVNFPATNLNLHSFIFLLGYLYVRLSKFYFLSPYKYALQVNNVFHVKKLTGHNELKGLIWSD